MLDLESLCDLWVLAHMGSGIPTETVLFQGGAKWVSGVPFPGGLLLAPLAGRQDLGESHLLEVPAGTH